MGHFGHVKMGNDAQCKIIDMEDVHLDTNIGCKLILKNVRHIPDICLNLISISVLEEEGYHNYFGEGKWNLIKWSLVIAKGKKYNSLYRMETNSYRKEMNAVDDFSTKLQHNWLGHLSENGMHILSKKQVIPNLKSVNLKVCTYCLLIKQHRVAFKSFPQSRKSNVLDLIHTDVCFLDDQNLGSAQYYVSFIDGHSRKV